MNNVKALVLNSGEIFKIAKSAGTEEVTSAVLLDNTFSELYGTNSIIRPPYNPDDLVNLLDANTFHTRCVKQKAIDTVGMGFKILPYDTDPNKVAGTEIQVKEVEDFFKNCNKKLTFEEVLERAAVDFESVGWLALEITRYKDTKPARINHIPAHTVRYRANGEGLIQKRNGKEVQFKWLFDEESKTDPNTQKEMTEVLYVADYQPKSDFYGIPGYIPAVGAMVANNYARDYNINFFGNNAIPQYAVIIEGGELDAEVEKVIQEHFKTNLKGVNNAHRTLILSGPEGVKIKLEPLAIEVKEGHFRLYRKDNRDEIVASHGVPGYRIGIIEVGALGGNVAQESTKIYKNTIINPRQQRLESRFTQILHKLFGLTTHYFKFNEIDTDDEKIVTEIEKNKAEAAKIWIEFGVLTPNQARMKYHGMANHVDDNGWGDIPYPLSKALFEKEQAKLQGGKKPLIEDKKEPEEDNGADVKKSQTLLAFENFYQAKKIS